MGKTHEMVVYVLTLGPDPHPVVKVYEDLVSESRRRGVEITKQDVHHLLAVLWKSRIASKSRQRGGYLVILPRVYFSLAERYAKVLGQGAEPGDFVGRALKEEGIGWCYDDFMGFVEGYGDLVSLFFGAIDSIYLHPDESFRAAHLSYMVSATVGGPHLLPGVRLGFTRRLSLAEKAFGKLYRRIKERVVELTREYRKPPYINARNIAVRALFYILGSEGVKRVLYYYGSSRPDPQLALLFSLNERLAELYEKWDRYLLTGGETD